MHPELCGCCEPPAPGTPTLITNRPGLSAIAYRVGTFATFRQAMLQAIAREPALQQLTTRQSDDPAITLLELWAAVADVLTFYQERIANEAFLRTARERDSVLRLVRLLDYELRTGLAATAPLAFTVDDEATVHIPVGLRVMSVPGQDEQPQFFETVQEVVADARLNRIAILPPPEVINPLEQGRQAAFLAADNLGWSAAKNLMPGERVVLFELSSDDQEPSTPPAGNIEVKSLFLHDVMQLDAPLRLVAPLKPWSTTFPAQDALTYWEFSWWKTLDVLHQFIDVPKEPEEKEIQEVRVEGDRFVLVFTSPVVNTDWTKDTQARVFTFKTRVFGYDAPATCATVVLEEITEGAFSGTDRPVWGLANADFGFESSSLLPLDRVYPDLVVGDELLIYRPLELAQLRTVTGLTEREQILPLVNAPASPLVDHRYRATVTVATLSEPISFTNRRNVTIYVLKKGPSIPLWAGSFPSLLTSGQLYIPAAKLDPDGEAIEIGRTIEGQELKSGVAIRLDEINAGRSILLEDHTHRPILATTKSNSLVNVEGQDFLVLDVTSSSELQLETRTAVLLGNVALATHGQTVADEILGSGDATQAFQRFTLQKPPLTQVPSARSARGESTLRVLINGEKWTEVDSLFGRLPSAHVYTTRQTDNGTTELRFGDGVTGARLPSGSANVVATYRQGAGLDGRVKADQLSILLDRPVGLKAVTNPAAAEGGADPESLDQARQAAPTTVKTFDRAVSLLDFETLATASGEVAKAKATVVWSGVEKAVHLTIAAQQGGWFSADALERLHSGLTQQRDPNQTLFLDNFRRVPIVVAAKLHIDNRYVRKEVEAAARQALLNYFAFEQMAFAQPIHLSDIYRLLQDVTGVAAVDIDTLHFKGYSGWSANQLATRDATNADVQSHLRMFPARARSSVLAKQKNILLIAPKPQWVVTDPVVQASYSKGPLPAILPAEQAFIESASDDIVLTATGGLA